MEKVGVMAVVEGLSSFVGDIGKMNSAMDSLKPKGNMLTNLFAGVTNALFSFGREILNVAEVALGALLARAIEYVITKLKELISATIQAGAEFQTMELRLNRLNFNTAIESGMEFGDAMAFATEATKDQMTWLQKLAVTTPYDAQDIANVFTLARSYGFASEAAKGLTQDISNFAAGMGLGNTEIERIIVNFGQMVQQGKVTQREMNDLARGAFVPVNDILKRMQENVGLTGKAFDKFRNSGEGVNAFMEAFSQIVSERFEGAAADMARTFQGATANAQDFVKSLIGFKVVTPILDVLGGRIADFISELTAPQKWDALTTAAGRVGFHLTALVEDILGLGPSTANLADRLVAGLNEFASWLRDHKGDVLKFFTGIRDAITQHVIPFIQRMIENLFRLRDWFVQNRPAIEAFFKNVGIFIQTKVVPFVLKLVTAFQKIGEWVGKNGPLIKDFFDSLGKIVGRVFEKLTGVNLGGGMEGFLGLVEGFMGFIVDNQETIAEFITNLIKLGAVFTAIGFVLGILMGIFTAIVTPILAVITVVGGLVTIIAALFTPIGLLIALIAVLVVQLLANWQYVVIAFEYLKQVIITWATETWAAISTWAINLWTTITTFLTNVLTAFITWAANLGATISAWLAGLVEAFGAFVTNAIAKFMEFLGGAEEVFQDIIQLAQDKVQEFVQKFYDIEWQAVGRYIIRGIEEGITKAIQALVDAAVKAVTAVVEGVTSTLGVHSPSKVFMGIGNDLMKGFALGITESAKLAENAMRGAVGLISAPALNLPAITQQYAMAAAPTVNNQNSYTNNWNLTVNSSAPTEPIVQDYNMLKSLAGA